MTPPRLARALLWFVYPKARREEALADLADLFVRRAQTHGEAYARRRYWRDAASFISPRTRGVATPGPTSRHRGAPMSALAFELRQVLRVTARRPAFLLIASLTLGVGFAAHLSAFSLVDRLLLAPPAHVQEADRIFRVHVDRADGTGRFVWFQTPYRSYRELSAGVAAFSEMAAYRAATASIGAGADARQLAIVFADAHYFPLLGARPRIGRVFGADDNRPPSGNPVIVLGDRYWRTALAGDPDVLGRTLRIGTLTYTVVGVMPEGFTGDAPEPVDAWAPLFAGGYELAPDWTTTLVGRTVSVLGKLAPGVSRSVASEQAAEVYRTSVVNTPLADPTARVLLGTLLPGRTIQGELNPSGRITVWIEAVALLVLLVALANVVNLQMSRAAQQRRDNAVRVALGASRGRVLGPVAVEMLMISAAAAGIGMLLTYVGSGALQLVLLPTAAPAVMPGRLVAVALATALLATVTIITFSALHIRMDGIVDRLKSGRGGDGFRRDRLRQVLLVAQVVVSTVLLVGAGLFLNSVSRLDRLQFGHDHDRVLVVTLPLRAAGYEPAAVERFYERALHELRSVPGIERVAAAQSTPFAPSQAATMSLPGQPPLPGNQTPTFYTVTPDFFATMGMTIVRGRGFEDGDRTGAPLVMILEEALAQSLWPGEDALGKCLVMGPPTAPCRQVVGIASNTRRFVSQATASLRYYLPLGQRYATATPQALFVRTTGDPLAAAPSVRAALVQLDPGIPYARMRTLQEMAEPEKRPWRLGSLLFAVFGAAALIVSTAGVYALLSFIVAQRSREIGVRLALGASPARTLRMIVSQSVGWAGAGLVVGAAVAIAVGRFVQPMLFETSPYDARVFAATAAVLVAVAVVASLGPAIRASRVDPNVALRAE